jgi:hypothetical protein
VKIVVRGPDGEVVEVVAEDVPPEDLEKWQRQMMSFQHGIYGDLTSEGVAV